MKTWQERALELRDDGLKITEIHEAINKEYGTSFTYDKVRSYLWRQRSRKVDIPDEWNGMSPAEIRQLDLGPQPIIQNQEPERHEVQWNGTKVIKFGLMGDTQFGSKYAQITYLHDFYNLCEREGITDIYHTGDITDGLKMRVGHEYELYEHSADGQLDDVITNYPKRDGITTHFITGNHDASLYKQVGYDIGAAIAKARPDMHYLGRDAAIVNLTPNCTLELRHPWDGSAYSISYKPQKMVEAMESDSKPNILAIGHYHKAEWLFYRNVHVIQTGCFQAQTPFTRGKGISVHLGGYIVTVRVDEDGTIRGLSPEFIPYYKSIKDDYKFYWRR